MKKLLLATIVSALTLCLPLNIQAKTKSVKNKTNITVGTDVNKLNITNDFIKEITVSMKGCQSVKNHLTCPPLVIHTGGKNVRFKDPELGTAGLNFTFKKGNKTYPLYVNLKQTCKHNYKWQKNGNMHVKKCKKCGSVSKKHKASFNKEYVEGSRYHYKPCQYKGCTITKGSHDIEWSKWKAYYVDQGSYHFRQCKKCKQNSKLQKHEWKTTKTKKEEIKTCSKCHYTKVRTKNTNGKWNDWHQVSIGNK